VLGGEHVVDDLVERSGPRRRELVLESGQRDLGPWGQEVGQVAVRSDQGLQQGAVELRQQRGAAPDPRQVHRVLVGPAQTHRLSTASCRGEYAKRTDARSTTPRCSRIIRLTLKEFLSVRRAR